MVDGIDIVLLPVAGVLVPLPLPPPTIPSFGNLGLMLMMNERNWVRQLKRLQKTPRKYVFLHPSTFFLLWIFLFFPRNFPFFITFVYCV